VAIAGNKISKMTTSSETPTPKIPMPETPDGGTPTFETPFETPVPPVRFCLPSNGEEDVEGGADGADHNAGARGDNEFEDNDDALSINNDEDAGFDSFFGQADEVEGSKVDWRIKKAKGATFITVGRARSEAWSLGIQEIKHMLKNLKRLLSTEDPMIDEVLDFFFGKKSPIFHAFEEQLGLEHQDFLKFLTSFFLQARYQDSASGIYDKDSRLSLAGCLSKEKYNAVWLEIEVLGQTPIGRGEVYLWKAMETAYNDKMRVLVIQGFRGAIKATVDDDKPHSQSRQKNTAALKNKKHVRDNRDGHTVHTMVYTASQLPVGIVWEQEKHTTAPSVLNELLDSQFLRCSGTLNGITLLMDRAYWPYDTVQYLLKNGADIHGTKMRDSWFLYTYDQRLTSQDTRISIERVGPRRLFVANSVPTPATGNKMFSAVAYRNNGNVTLGLTSEILDHEWDLTPRKPTDILRYNKLCQLSDEFVFDEEDTPGEDPEDKPAYCVRQDLPQWCNKLASNVEDTSEYERLIDGLKSIRPVTCGQSDPTWFTARMFSLTSSTTDRLVKHVLASGEWMQERNADAFHRDSWKQLKDYLGDHAPQEEATPAGVEDIQLEEPVVDGQLDYAAIRASALEANDETRARTDEELKNRLPLLSLVQLKGIVSILGGKSVAREQGNIKKVVTFLECNDIFVRPYIIKGKSDLVSIATKKGFDKDESKIKTSDELAIMLGEHDRSTGGVSGSEAPMDSLQKDLIRLMLESSFMPKLTAKTKEYCKVGKNNEDPVMRKVLEHSNERQTTHKIDVAYKWGLVEEVERPQNKGSVDFVCGGRKDLGGGVFSDEGLFAVEVKTRTTGATIQQEHHRQRIANNANPRFNGVSVRERYVEVSPHCAVFKLQMRDSHEKMQIMHHAYLVASTVLLVIGKYYITYCNSQTLRPTSLTKSLYLLNPANRDCNIIKGLWVEFDEVLLTAYRRVLQDIFSLTLAWAYRDGGAALSEIELPVKLILQDKANKDSKALQVYSFDEIADAVDFWDYFSRKLVHPVPPCKTMVPLIFSIWNALKSGSDTLTKIMSHHQPNVPRKGPQAVAVQRNLMIVAGTMHRILQHVEAKEDLENNYGTLEHYRRAANDRRPFKKTLSEIVALLTSLTGGAGGPDDETLGDALTQVELFESDNEEDDGDEDAGVLDLAELVHKASIGTQQTFLTPARKKGWRSLLGGDKDEMTDTEAAIQDRTTNCCGIPLYRLGFGYLDGGRSDSSGGPGRCFLCGDKTHWWCGSCHRYLCHGVMKSNKAEQLKMAGIEPFVQLENFKVKTGGKYKCALTFRTCFVEAHFLSKDVGEEDL
jgi:hypothetical protein